SNSFDRSATYQSAGYGKFIAAFVRFILVQLRNSRCHKLNVLFHNKPKQFTAALPDVQQVARSWSNRYAPDHTAIQLESMRHTSSSLTATRFRVGAEAGLMMVPRQARRILTMRVTSLCFKIIATFNPRIGN